MRVLRHHFGWRAFEPEYKVQMLCEGHTEVSVGSIKYEYEDGAIPEVLDYTEKNIADECVAQLKVSTQQTLFLFPCLVPAIVLTSIHLLNVSCTTKTLRLKT